MPIQKHTYYLLVDKGLDWKDIFYGPYVRDLLHYDNNQDEAERAMLSSLRSDGSDFIIIAKSKEPWADETLYATFGFYPSEDVFDGRDAPERTFKEKISEDTERQLEKFLGRFHKGQPLNYTDWMEGMGLFMKAFKEIIDNVKSFTNEYDGTIDYYNSNYRDPDGSGELSDKNKHSALILMRVRNRFKDLIYSSYLPNEKVRDQLKDICSMNLIVPET
ncbi:MAG: hypothetical protein KIG36_03535 [Eubacteriales bacterium]|nr:hypothetical protein [Eubacteriales bacterium]